MGLEKQFGTARASNNQKLVLRRPVGVTFAPTCSGDRLGFLPSRTYEALELVTHTYFASSLVPPLGPLLGFSLAYGLAAHLSSVCWCADFSGCGPGHRLHPRPQITARAAARATQVLLSIVQSNRCTRKCYFESF